MLVFGKSDDEIFPSELTLLTMCSGTYSPVVFGYKIIYGVAVVASGLVCAVGEPSVVAV